MAMTLRTDEELDRVLTELAEMENLSRQEVIRRAVLEKYERDGRRTRVDAISNEMVERWGDVLDRLGKA